MTSHRPQSWRRHLNGPDITAASTGIGILLLLIGRFTGLLETADLAVLAPLFGSLLIASGAVTARRKNGEQGPAPVPVEMPETTTGTGPPATSPTRSDGA